MGVSENAFDDDLTPRDIVLLKARVENPTVSVRKIRDILEDEYGISLSHNRVNELLHEMETDEVLQTQVVPNVELFDYYLFRIAFHYPNFEEQWEKCYWELSEDPHVVFFTNADDYYHWILITQFHDDRGAEQWMHHFFKNHGDLIAQFDNTKLPSIHKFYTSGDVLNERLWETEEGREYLQNSRDKGENSDSALVEHENNSPQTISPREEKTD